MKLNEKRKVIEVLLCCSAECSPDVTDTAAYAAGLGTQLIRSAADAQWLTSNDDFDDAELHHVVSTKAAYRLIESSPTLRREWFGRP